VPNPAEQGKPDFVVLLPGASVPIAAGGSDEQLLMNDGRSRHAGDPPGDAFGGRHMRPPEAGARTFDVPQGYRQADMRQRYARRITRPGYAPR
jgi:hypothetical protein